MFLICFALGFDSSERKKCCVSRAYAVCVLGDPKFLGKRPYCCKNSPGWGDSVRSNLAALPCRLVGSACFCKLAGVTWEGRGSGRALAALNGLIPGILILTTNNFLHVQYMSLASTCFSCNLAVNIVTSKLLNILPWSCSNDRNSLTLILIPVSYLERQKFIFIIRKDN